MGIKTSNEITVRIAVSKEEFIEFLKKSGFEEKERFSLDDYYLIPKDLDLGKISEREILAKAVIIRNISENSGYKKKITFKVKNINPSGEIISQEAINCDIYDKDEAIRLFEAIGYYEIMNIKENDIVYGKDNFEIAVKYLPNKTLIEIETDDNFDTIEKLKEEVIRLNFPIDTSNFFVKKAEEQLREMLQE